MSLVALYKKKWQNRRDLQAQFVWDQKTVEGEKVTFANYPFLPHFPLLKKNF